MDCNKDEAIRVKNIAEGKYKSKDFAGAHRFALMAHRLFPALEGIAQMITTFNIHVAWTVKIGKDQDDDKDWYSILSVPMWADEVMLKRRYRELILQIHPDKNRSVGADDAFKMVQKAWNVLSNKQTRASFDQKFKVHITSTSLGAARESDNNVAASTEATKPTTESAVQQSRPGSTPPHCSARAPVRSSRKEDKLTFWTACSKCYMQYELYTECLNLNILCPSETCSQPFIAVDKQSTAPEHVDLDGDLNTRSADHLKRTENTVDSNAGAGACGSASGFTGRKRNGNREFKHCSGGDASRDLNEGSA